MNYFEVVNKENIGKSYKMTIDRINEGVWTVENGTTEEFELYRKGAPITDIYFSSQLIRMEFEEVVDWSWVPVDTKVLVSDDGKDWNRRHFAKYEDGKVYCFDSGATSFSADIISDVVEWKYAKLYQE